jgi:hypothetical protein
VRLFCVSKFAFVLLVLSFMPCFGQDTAETTRKAATDAAAAASQAYSAATTANTAADNAKAATQDARTAAQDLAKVAKQAASDATAARKDAADARSISEQNERLTHSPDRYQPDAAVPDDTSDNLNDYVPCLMDRKTLFAMRGRIAPPLGRSPVTREAAEKIVLQTSTKFSSETLRQYYVEYAETGLDETSHEGILTSADLSNVLGSAARATIEFSKRSQPNEHSKAAIEANAKAANEAAAVQQEGQQETAAISSYQRPKDIGCSMSVYPWSIAHMVFGRTVADHYLAVQVTVRNLDSEHEFLIHDAELAVDASSGQLERFQEGHEKQAVRGVTLFGQMYDRRANWGHAVEAIGMIMGSVVGIPSNDNFTAAAGAYTAGFIPSFQKLFPDLTTSNLNNLNDLGFSAAAASRIVVPKGGSVPFVIFVPVGPLQQACWLQKGYVPSMDYLPRTACDAIYLPPPTGRHATSKSLDYSSPTGQQPHIWDPKQWPVKVTSKNISKWSADELTALQKHAFAVVAGTHIQPANAGPSALRIISCQGANDGIIRVATVVGQPVTCNLTGANLDAVVTFRLKALTSSGGATPIDLPLTQTGDSTTAKVTLSVDNIKALTDSGYAVYGVDKTGAESDLHQNLIVVPLPIVNTAAPVPATAAAAAGATQVTVTLTGTNLAQVTKVQLQPSGGGALIDPSSFMYANGKITAAFPIAALAAGTKYNVMLVVGGSVSPIDSTQSFTF